MFSIILTLVLSNTMSTTIVGQYDDQTRCEEVKELIQQSYVGSSVKVFTAKCVPIK